MVEPCLWLKISNQIEPATSWITASIIMAKFPGRSSERGCGEVTWSDVANSRSSKSSSSKTPKSWTHSWLDLIMKFNWTKSLVGKSASNWNTKRASKRQVALWLMTGAFWWIYVQSSGFWNQFKARRLTLSIGMLCLNRWGQVPQQLVLSENRVPNKMWITIAPTKMDTTAGALMQIIHLEQCGVATSRVESPPGPLVHIEPPWNWISHWETPNILVWSRGYICYPLVISHSYWKWPLSSLM